MRRLGLILLCLAASLWLAPLAAAEEGPPEWAYRLAHDVMSPFCPGRTLAECPSPQADELRVWILTQAAAGASRDEVENSLYERFGDEIRSAPKAEGWGLTAYAIPIVGFALGGVGAVFAIRRMRGASAGPTPSPDAGGPAPAIDPELERKLDEDLRAG